MGPLWGGEWAQESPQGGAHHARQFAACTWMYIQRTPELAREVAGQDARRPTHRGGLLLGYFFLAIQEEVTRSLKASESPALESYPLDAVEWKLCFCSTSDGYRCAPPILLTVPNSILSPKSTWGRESSNRLFDSIGQHAIRIALLFHQTDLAEIHVADQPEAQQACAGTSHHDGSAIAGVKDISRTQA